MKHKIKYLLLLPIIATLASCGGYSLEYIVEGDRYLSPDFNKNYYEHWDNEFIDAFKSPTRSFDLNDTDKYKSIMSFKDIADIDPSLALSTYSDAEEFGEDYKLNKVDDCFNYGVQSKLFDGISFCRSRYQRVRVQARKKGFSVRLSKESDELDYFAIHFKATTNNQIGCYMCKDYPERGKNKGDKCTVDDDYFHNSSFDLTISLYCKDDDNKIVNYSFVKTITFENNTTNNGREANYKFFAFKASELDIGKEETFTISRMIGFSVTFDNLNDELITYNRDEKSVDISEDDYALFIYEVFMPHTYWH